MEFLVLLVRILASGEPLENPTSDACTYLSQLALISGRSTNLIKLPRKYFRNVLHSLF